jgi:predicted Rossmann fold nucleotide-binding protein DprA/Smf involved in DNA uptake
MRDCDDCLSEDEYRALELDRSGAVYSAVADLAAVAGWRHARAVTYGAMETVAALIENLPAEDHDGLAEPWPDLSRPQRAAMVALSAGPRLVCELADTCGWSAGTTGSVLAALRRRGLVEEVSGLWARL